MKSYKLWLCLWALVILLGIGIGVNPFVQRQINEVQLRSVIKAYLQGEKLTEEMLQGETMLGVLWVPKIDCLLPIWEGSSEAVLQQGTGRMEGSSEITDALGTHTVLCAHSGLPQLYAFDQIDLLEKGDAFYVIRHGLVLIYTVTNQSTVLPEEVHLLLQPSQFANQITLLTCTPYGVNTHRLLVQAELSRSFGGSAACK